MRFATAAVILSLVSVAVAQNQTVRRLSLLFVGTSPAMYYSHPRIAELIVVHRSRSMLEAQMETPSSSSRLTI